MMCGRCKKMMGILVLILGILFLLQNFGVWRFWGIQWYTIVFILIGFKMIGSSCCKECQSCQMDMKSKKK